MRSCENYIGNMVYVGVLAQILGIDLDKIKAALAFHFKDKTSAIDLNYGMVESAYLWSAGKHKKNRSIYEVLPMDVSDGKIMADGNTAAALGCNIWWCSVCWLVSL